MIEITSTKELLDPSGRLATAGYATHMNFNYDKSAVKCPPLRLKEWDFYQVHFDDRYVLQMTVGHVSYAVQISAALLDLKTGVCRRVGKTTARNASFIKNMPVNPEVPNTIRYFSRNAHVQFEVTDKFRRLAMTFTDFSGIKAEINLELNNVSKNKEKMVIAIPFADPRQWYLNYKENCFVVNGYCRIEDVAYDIKDGFGLLDWGRGVWPYHHNWVWGNGGTLVDGKHFGFNIGWGFGNTEAATENMFFYDNKAYKLGIVTEIQMGDTYRYVDLDKRFVFSVEPIYDNFTKTNMLWVKNKCHQLFGKWSGYVVLDDGTKVDVPPFVAFCEKAENNW
ncbi:MAG: DUF2804 domain-containing protein [Clostridiales bacterium]|nr:DUF2804 domain-containing protein [Clostridiales bacterium]